MTVHRRCGTGGAVATGLTVGAAVIQPKEGIFPGEHPRQMVDISRIHHHHQSVAVIARPPRRTTIGKMDAAIASVKGTGWMIEEEVVNPTSGMSELQAPAAIDDHEGHPRRSHRGAAVGRGHLGRQATTVHRPSVVLEQAVAAVTARHGRGTVRAALDDRRHHPARPDVTQAVDHVHRSCLQ